ncbi:helix-turn-helix transcriptional regulator [Glaciihabitans sp. INWT7]|uniref:helix-turn-helix domain-containing protein n=1 Tax=Glaciihabitans sp. INWT7 TaxID=2596912 RepID=UPI0016232545|nr:helix-turn-helix transcriptional regulator [Glaciihabitans sp. INWT7]QNE47631.1 helix-turn-helix transcriptional regulator [Glaciihabitans sp. INWT7]
MSDSTVLDDIGPHLRALRAERGLTLADLSETTGISVSTLSRLESGQRKATLELLLPISRAHQVSLDDLVTPHPVADPRVRTRGSHRSGVTTFPLSREPSAIAAFKQVIAASKEVRHPTPGVHDGYEWLYVLSGKLRLVLGPHDLVLVPGEVAEFDTRVPHWFGSADQGRVEYLTLFSKQGERMHVAVSTGGGRK